MKLLKLGLLLLLPWRVFAGTHVMQDDVVSFSSGTVSGPLRAGASPSPNTGLYSLTAGAWNALQLGNAVDTPSNSEIATRYFSQNDATQGYFSERLFATVNQIPAGFAFEDSSKTPIVLINLSDSTNGSLTDRHGLMLPATGYVTFFDSATTHYDAFRAPTHLTQNNTWIWPTTDSSGSQCLASNGSGSLSWTACSGGGGSTSLTPTVTVTASTNTAMVLNQGATSNDPNALTINQRGQGNALKINQQGLAGAQFQGSGSLYVNMSGASQPSDGIVVYSSATDNQIGQAMIRVWADTPTYNDPMIWEKRVGANSAPALRIDANTQAKIEFYDTSLYVPNVTGRGAYNAQSSDGNFTIGYRDHADTQFEHLVDFTAPYDPSSWFGGQELVMQSTGAFVMADNTGHAAGIAPSLVMTTSTLWRWPAGDSSGTQCLSSNGSGVLGWSGCSSAGSPVVLTAANASNQVPLTINQNDTTNNKNGLVITSTGTGSGFIANLNGKNYSTNNNQAGFLVSCGQDGTLGNCAEVYSNAGTQTALTGVLSVISANTNWNTATLYVQANGTNPQNGIRIDGKDYSTLELIDTKQVAPNGKFQFSSHNNQFRGERRAVSNTQYESVWTIAASTISTQGLMYVGTDYDNPSSTFSVSGNVIIGDGYAGASTGGSAPRNGLLVQGHIVSPTAGTTPGVSSCGSGPSITGSDQAGVVTTGTGSPTACTLTFASAWGAAPACVATTTSTSSTPALISNTTTAITFSFSSSPIKFYYFCMGPS